MVLFVTIGFSSTTIRPVESKKNNLNTWNHMKTKHKKQRHAIKKTHNGIVYRKRFRNNIIFNGDICIGKTCTEKDRKYDDVDNVFNVVVYYNSV